MAARHLEAILWLDEPLKLQDGRCIQPCLWWEADEGKMMGDGLIIQVVKDTGAVTLRLTDEACSFSVSDIVGTCDAQLASTLRELRQ